MNMQLISSAFGTMLALAAMMPNPAPVVQEITPTPAQVNRGNLTISTVPGNTWVQVTDYTYTPRIPPNLDLSGWAEGFPVKAVVRDARNTCVGRITNESGQLAFIFVEADPAMCGNVPGKRQELAHG